MSNHIEEKYFKYLISGLVIGAVVGVAITLFRILLGLVQDYMMAFLGFTRNSLFLAPLFLIVMVVAGLIVGLATQKDPMIGGSGIPQVLGQMKGKIHTEWYSVFPLKFLAGLISLGTGLTVGREGPSVQMGASLGQAFGDLMHFPKDDRKMFMTSGAAAGLAAAFNAPVSGLVFVLEELYHKFDKVIFITTLSAAVAANYVSALIVGFSPVIHLGEISDIPLSNYHYIFILGVIIGLLSPLFTYGIKFTKALYAKLDIPLYMKIVIPFIISGIIIYINPERFGSGEPYIFLPLGNNLPLSQVTIVLLLKFFLLITAFSSGMPGGIFLPMLVLGSLIGNAYGQILHSMGLVETQYILLFSALGMCANFSAIVRSPLTGIILLLELTGSFQYFLPIALVVLVADVVVEVIKLPPVYEMLLDKMLREEKKNVYNTKTG